MEMLSGNTFLFTGDFRTKSSGRNARYGPLMWSFVVFLFYTWASKQKVELLAIWDTMKLIWLKSNVVPTVQQTTEAGLSTHWGRVTHICVGKLTIIGSDNGLSPERRQAIIWTNAGIVLIWPLGTNFSEILIGIQTFSFKKIHLKM